MDQSVSILLLLAFLPIVAGTAGSAFTTRSWDCCKPACSWNGTADVSAPVAVCDATNKSLRDFDEESSCGSGNANLCANQQPWQIHATTSYGYAAARLKGQDRSEWCCACYNLTFTSGVVRNHTMVVQAISMLSNTLDNTFNLLVSSASDSSAVEH